MLIPQTVLRGRSRLCKMLVTVTNLTRRDWLLGSLAAASWPAIAAAQEIGCDDRGYFIPPFGFYDASVK